MKQRAYFMPVIDGVFCMGRACDKQTLDALQSLRLTKVRLCLITVYVRKL